MDASEPAGSTRFLTLSDICEVLNVSLREAHGLVRSGELPAIKIGASGQWRVEREVLESYIQDGYEESRRMALWNESEFSSLQEPSFGSSE